MRLLDLRKGLYVWKSSRAAKGFWETVGQSTLGVATLNPQASLGGDQVLYATGAAIVIGCIVAKIQNHSIPHQVLRALRLTNRTNEVDIWGFMLNSPNLDSWVTVRHSNGKIYQGWV